MCEGERFFFVSQRLMGNWAFSKIENLTFNYGALAFLKGWNTLHYRVQAIILAKYRVTTDVKDRQTEPDKQESHVCIAQIIYYILILFGLFIPLMWPKIIAVGMLKNLLKSL